MECLLTVAELGLSLLLIVFWGFISVVVFEAWRRRHSNVSVETVTTLEDPTSLKQVSHFKQLFYHQVLCPHISDPAEKYLSLIVPAFNEEQRLPAALEETMDYLQGRASRDKNFSYEVVIVDDGSVDGTKRVAFDFVKKYTVDNIRFIPLGKNQGKGEAIRTVSSTPSSRMQLYLTYHFMTQKILALDLHTEEFRSVRTPPRFCKSGQIANLEDRLVVAAKDIGELGFKFCIWSMDPRDETWSIAYSFHLSSSTRSSFISRCSHWWHWCMPLAVSKRGNLYFYDQEKKVHKYCSDTGLVRGVTYGGDIRIVAPFVENLLPIRGSASSGRTFGFRNLDEFETSSCFRQIKSSVRKEWLGITTTVVAVVALVVFLK
ncbi:hypothetical protein F2Q70_00008634 [Brassica cretica]|uniref:Glycosyltransferase 2-like domain-containing protein n=1 Tax=Brassica cretica TaxID=69181 RepID=A0A8S9M189_BRACR|nr:hypothetical protein F2Q70_00008634 [Brassica cretica]